MKRCALVLALLVPWLGGCLDEPPLATESSALVFNIPTVQSIASSFTAYDLDGDGIREINSLTLMSFEPATPLGSGAAGLAIVLVDPRLLSSFPGSLASTLNSHLINYRDDLVREGYQTRFLIADVYRGVQHQDGRTLLAMRRFLQTVRNFYPQLAGVTLVGSFPEATLFRRVLARVVDNGQQYLELHPERVNPRAEIVLADLDGLWEPLYLKVADLEELKMQVPNGISFPATGQLLSGTVTTLQNVHWEDVFYLQDDQVTRVTAASGPGAPVTVRIDSTAQRNPELTSADRALPNPMARPEILVSRLDAKGVAVNPVYPPDRFGRTPLAADGKPQEVEYDFWYPEGDLFTWQRDPILEQRVLADYFARNHQHRLGVAPALSYRTSAIRQQQSGLVIPADFNNVVLRKADPAGFGASLGIEEANLADYVGWLKTPAVLRGISSHSTGRLSGFGLPPSVPALETALGGRVFAWQMTATASGGMRFTPSAEPLGGDATWAVARTLWENGMLAGAGSAFYIHGGCSVNVPDENLSFISYDEDFNGFKNNGDSVLFFENGLGLMARGKVFLDLPLGAGESIAAAGGRFGSAWRGAFDVDAANATLKPGTNGDTRVYSNKKAYFWGLRGDWSAKLKY